MHMAVLRWIGLTVLMHYNIVFFPYKQLQCLLFSWCQLLNRPAQTDTCQSPHWTHVRKNAFQFLASNLNLFFSNPSSYLIDVCFGCDWFVSLDKLIFCELCLLCTVMNDEIILYWVITHTHLHTLFNLLNLTFGNILNCWRMFSAEK